ncbi:MAG: hypothetical protein ACLRJC_05990, partial [Emergencia timonensis]
KAVGSMRSLYHEYSFENRIEIHDSMIPTLRQRREILESLYHDNSFGNRIERHDSMIPTLRQRREILESL